MKIVVAPSGSALKLKLELTTTGKQHVFLLWPIPRKDVSWLYGIKYALKHAKDCRAVYTFIMITQKRILPVAASQSN